MMLVEMVIRCVGGHCRICCNAGRILDLARS